jgi:hypothetical protein
MADSPKAQVPIMISLALVLAGAILGAVGGLANGSILGGVVAACGAVPACWAAWAGLQKKTQASLGIALLLVFVSLGVGGILILLRVVDWLR